MGWGCLICLHMSFERSLGRAGASGCACSCDGVWFSSRARRDKGACQVCGGLCLEPDIDAAHRPLYSEGVAMFPMCCIMHSGCAQKLSYVFVGWASCNCDISVSR